MDNPPNLSRSKTLFLRIMFIIAVVCGIMIVALKMLERAGEPLRQGVQNYIADVTQSRVYVSALPDPEFFPDVHVRIEGVIFNDVDDPNKKIAEAEKIEFSVPFVNLMIGRQAFDILDVQNLSFEKDVFLPEAFNISRIEIMPDASPRLQMTGMYGDHPIKAHVDIMRRGSATDPSYSLDDNADFDLFLGPASMRGHLASEGQQLMLKDVILSHEKGQKYGPQDFILVKNQEFIKDNPISCLLEQGGSLALTATHPCATLFEQNNQVTETP